MIGLACKRLLHRQLQLYRVLAARPRWQRWRELGTDTRQFDADKELWDTARETVIANFSKSVYGRLSNVGICLRVLERALSKSSIVGKQAD